MDLEASVTFYERLFGAVRIPTYLFGFPVQFLRVGDQQLHVFERPAQAPVFHHFALEVDDFDSLYRAAAEMGVFEGETFGSHAYELPDGAVQLYVRDPAGNLVEIDWPDVTSIASDVREQFGRLSDRVPQTGDALTASLFSGDSHGAVGH